MEGLGMPIGSFIAIMIAIGFAIGFGFYMANKKKKK